MSVSLTLDKTLLGSFYQPFEPKTNTSSAWNYNNSAYFISQGSEYYLGMPFTSTKTQGLTQTEINNIQSSISALVTALNHNKTSGNQAEVQELVAELNTWSSGLTLNENVQLLTATTLLTHIRNDQTNDTANLTLTYAWVPALSVAVLASLDLDIVWEGSHQGLNTGVKTLHGMVTTANLEKDFIESVLVGFGLESLGVGLTILTVASFALSMVDMVASTLINLANDGGRVNFVGVIAHAIHRISSCVRPAPAAGSLQTPTLDLNGLGYTWITAVKDSSLIAGASANVQNALIKGTYPDLNLSGENWSGNVLISGFNADVLYAVGLPELSWGLNGASLLLTSKIEVDHSDEKVYALAIMLFSSSGQVARVSTFVQEDSSSGSVRVPNPISYPTSYLVPDPNDRGIYPLGQVIGGEFHNTDIYQPSSLQLEWVVPELMVAIQNNIVARSVGSNWTTMPQPSTGYSIDWNIGTSHYDSGQHATIGVDSSNNVLQLHDGGTSNIYWDIGSLSGNTVSWGTVGSKRGSGTYPTMCFISGSSHFVEIHSGGTSDLYWETGDINSSDIWDQNGGSKISSGDHPAMAMNSGGQIVVLFVQGNNSLQFDLGQRSANSSISWPTKNVNCGTGDHGAVVLTDNGHVLEVHSYKGDLYYNVGIIDHPSPTNYEDINIGWYYSSELPLNVKGDHAGLALRADGLVCLVYDTDNTLYYGMGILDSASGSINWITLNNKYTTGAFAAVTFAPDGSAVETHQANSNNNTDQYLYWGVGAIQMP